MERASRVLVLPVYPQELPHLPGCGAGSPARLSRSPAAAHPARLRARSKVELEVPSHRSLDPMGRGHRTLLQQGSGAARSPLCNPAAEGGIGRFPPTPAPGGGAEAPAARVSCPGARHGGVRGPGFAAAGRRLPSGPVARPGRGRSRRGLVPEGDSSRARSRPPAGPAAARRRPAAPRRHAAPRRAAGRAPDPPSRLGDRGRPPGTRSSPAAPARFPCSPPPYWYL